MLEPLSLWQSTLKAIPNTDQSSWPRNLSRWMAERTSSKLELKPTIIGSVLFTFNFAAFENGLRSCGPTDSAMSAARQMANAWGAAVSQSTMIVLPGSSMGAPSPATTWSVVTSLLDPPSTMAAQIKLAAQLLAVQAVSDGYHSKMAEAYRNAFLSLTATATGVNSLPIPTPLISPFTRTS